MSEYSSIPKDEFNTAFQAGAYAVYYSDISSGILLKSVSIRIPGLITYLRKHGMESVSPLDTARGVVYEPLETHDEANATMQALSAIAVDESKGVLPEGSHTEACLSLMCSEFETSSWYGYGQITEPEA